MSFAIFWVGLLFATAPALWIVATYGRFDDETIASFYADMTLDKMLRLQQIMSLGVFMMGLGICLHTVPKWSV